MEIIELFINKMHKEGIPQLAIDTFIRFYEKVKSGDTGLISESEISPVHKEEIDNVENIHCTPNKLLLKQLVCIKLNGGLGTTMGLRGPKSLIPVKGNLNFLDIIANQICSMNAKYDIKIPLILMNSFRTEKESLDALKKYPALKTSLPLSFLQHKFPKVLVSNLLPAQYPEDPELEWNPPGHGDLYTALQTSGILDSLIEKGYRFAFVSNIDNLGATVDPGILQYLSDQSIPFLMEVTERTSMDRKGGHLARLKNGHLILRDAAQCPESDLEYFKDISRHFFFNTNNLWINLVILKEHLEKSHHYLDLPIIRNKKKINPIEKRSADVYQLESSMGSAISVFKDAKAIRVPRTRFAPVKSCDELLLLWSDAYNLNDQYQIVENSDKKFKNIVVKLDPTYYAFLNQLKERFPFGAPSFIECSKCVIEGDIKFGKNVKLYNEVNLVNKSSVQKNIIDNSTLTGNIELD